MESLTEWLDSFERSVSESLFAFWAYLPQLAAALVVLVLGWLVARLTRALLLRSGSALNRLLSQLERSVSARRIQISRRLVALIANLAFWIIVLFFAAAAARIAGLDTFSVWLDRVIEYLPTLVAGLLIAVAGYLLSSMVRDIVATTLASVGSSESELASLAAQGTVFITAVVIGLDQIGIDVTFLITLASVIIAGILLSLALAFGFGARDFVANLIAARQLRNTIEVGEFARCGDAQGRVLEITATAVVLLNDKCRVIVPAGNLQKQSSEVMLGQADE